MRWLENGWFERISADYANVLQSLDRDPRPLRQLVDSRRDRRLGSYFEALWRFWLGDNRRYHLLYANLPLHTGSRTLGEFDFLVQDRKTGKTLHWEIAVKFYLGVADTSQAANWLGPARQDRLDIKTRRLLSHQSKLSRYPEAAELFERLGIRVDETWLILKGRLFYPARIKADQPQGAFRQHLRGFWLALRSLPLLESSLWLPLEHRQWLAPLAGVDPATCLDSAALMEKWRHTGPQHPVCVARIVEGMEVERGFIVNDEWTVPDTRSLQ